MVHEVLLIFEGQRGHVTVVIANEMEMALIVVKRELRDVFRLIRIAIVGRGEILHLRGRDELLEHTAVLAENAIGIFAVSTYNTDYILVKAENFEKAEAVLSKAGYSVIDDKKQ
jgi:hypothetical protein